ncbi:MULTISPECIES: ArsR/SmtB family transcription factor [Amycolatopsis]|uniref:Helix-turn-helix transcriptional regulator n=1 Tax=Amycolatopsis dendrobii TaxID=2760662 RepID=A0A7W3VWU0_9PSEU|nr:MULTISPECIES: metalloregulator ArsR/SmtB family transcription factor [Amycolatopsis]MBB1154531.1 helix-turn-helix transcriptional regulator [Amycolatopsis dendrobii]UKD56645.1 metalloregulator ArsR/SmtB family transcription factor [Amycolatopsis sp. FU40]
MPLTLELSTGDLAGTRLAVSPLSETVSGLQTLAGCWGPRHGHWTRWAAGELAARPLDLSRTWPLLVTGRAGWPQFLLPAPARAASTIDEALAAMCRTTPSQVRRSLRGVFGEHLPVPAQALADDPEAGLRAVAAELRQAHDRLIAPHWARLRAVLDADIAYRAKQWADGGAARLFTDLHAGLNWHDGRLTLDGDHRPSPGRPAGGLVLSPVVLGPPWVMIKLHTTTQTTIRYPARGSGALWTAAERRPGGNAVRLLGRRRAELLETLRSPATTTDLAEALHVSPSAVSQHLRVLRDSGLVAGQRSGRAVLYRTTEQGIRLLSPGSPTHRRQDVRPGSDPTSEAQM